MVCWEKARDPSPGRFLTTVSQTHMMISVLFHPSPGHRLQLLDCRSAIVADHSDPLRHLGDLKSAFISSSRTLMLLSDDMQQQPFLSSSLPTHTTPPLSSSSTPLFPFPSLDRFCRRSNAAQRRRAHGLMAFFLSPSVSSSSSLLGCFLLPLVAAPPPSSLTPPAHNKQRLVVTIKVLSYMDVWDEVLSFERMRGTFGAQLRAEGAEEAIGKNMTQTLTLDVSVLWESRKDEGLR